MGVVVPWSPPLFQYTVKDVARPAAGRLWVDGLEHAVPAGESWAVLDHGRGRWPTMRVGERVEALSAFASRMRGVREGGGLLALGAQVCSAGSAPSTTRKPCAPTERASASSCVTHSTAMPDAAMRA